MINPNRLIALGCWILLATFQGCSGESDNADVRFAKTTFFAMVNGTAPETVIDWETFRSPTDDLGAIYKALPSDAEKADFRKSFLIGFSASTPNLKANPDSVMNWRVQSETPAETVVAANRNDGALLLITVTKRDGTQEISSLTLQK